MQCVNKNLREYQTLKKLSGLPDFVLSTFVGDFLNKYGRYPYLDELPNSDSSKAITEDLQLDKNGTTKTENILQATNTNNVDEAVQSLNDKYRDKEIEILEVGTKSKIYITERPTTNPKILIQDSILTELNTIKQRAIANGTFMKAPNGKPTNLNERQWLQVRTKAFKDWFGDWEKVAKPYNRIKSKQATVRLNKLSGGKFNINPDTMQGVILTDTNEHSIFTAMGRTFVLCNVNGNVIPFYQSSKGTSGKIKGAWYPFFGYNGNWLIKGDVDSNGKMSYSSEIDRITDLLNKDFKIPTDFDTHGISASTGINVKDLGLNMYSVFDRFGKIMESMDTTDPDAFVFYDKDLKEVTNANALFVKEITGIKTQGIHQSHYSSSFIKPFIDATETNNASKVVDENGEPLVVWHGSKESNKINVFYDRPTYFSDRYTAFSYTPFEAEDETEYMYPCFLNIRNPKEVNGNGAVWNNINGLSTDDIVKSTNKEDGVIIKDIKDYSDFAPGNPDLSRDLLEEAPLHTDYIVKNPNQIKSATDNSGEFSIENNDITDNEINSFHYFNEVLDKLQTLYGINIIPITNAELNSSQWRDITGVNGVKAFIYNGNIYLNTDIATVDSPVHEFLHLLFGSMKYQNRGLYDLLVNSAELFETFSEIAENYPNRTRGDINEEVFVTELAKYLTGQPSAINNLPNAAKHEIFYNVNRTLDSMLMGDVSVKTVLDPYLLSLKSLALFVNSASMESGFNGSMDDATLNRVMANTKSELMKKGELREDCE